MRKRRAAGIALVVVLLACAFALGLLFTARSSTILSESQAPPATGETGPSAIEEVREALANSYYETVDREVLQEETIAGLLEELGDPNTDYLTASEYQLLKNRTARSYSGIGLTVEPSRAGLVVTSALTGPARAAGVRRGDIIVRIEGRPAGKLTFEQALNLIKGEKGTVVHITVRRPGREGTKLTVMRQEISVPSLHARPLRFRSTRLGYVRLMSFPDAAADHLREAVDSLVKQGAKGIVLDLRGNPGGLLPQAVRTVSVFLDEGVVCTIAGLHQEETVYEVTGTASHASVPLVVAVDRGSASAAEIVAAALEAHDRAILVGGRTYGKASVQSIRPLSNGTALKLTTAMYKTPDGRDLTHRGVRPKIRVVDDPLTAVDEVLRVAQATLVKQIAAA
jgi:carboxyl-terminal processing protease